MCHFTVFYINRFTVSFSMWVAVNQEKMKTLIILALFFAYTFAMPEETEDEIEDEDEDPGHVNPYGRYGSHYKSYKPQPKYCTRRLCKVFQMCKFRLKKVCTPSHCPKYGYGHCKYTYTKTPAADCRYKYPMKSCWNKQVKCGYY